MRFIKRSQDLGFTLAEINKLVTLTANEDLSCGEVRQFASQKLKEIELKIRDLQNIKSVLEDLLSKCNEGQINICPIIERLSE
ncbi:MerR family DNA-binding protein [Paradesulfitobacterium aromaticivorans]